ncbi:MAG TPA: ArsR family transcriptional regulator [Candidatus Thermoplasmatota archaeon]|nr:ArsR family transcriptional regulator [Candidatus Thermoplasmatota archaeon]
MKRVKVVSDPSDLVPLLRLFDSPLKRAVFRDVAVEWHSAASIAVRHGPSAVEVLEGFEKARIVETKWESVDGAATKFFRSYYASVQLACTVPVQEMGEIIGVASMGRDEFAQAEGEIWQLAAGEGALVRMVSEKLNTPLVRLQCLVKRSRRLDLRGHLIVRRPD